MSSLFKAGVAWFALLGASLLAGACSDTAKVATGDVSSLLQFVPPEGLVAEACPFSIGAGARCFTAPGAVDAQGVAETVVSRVEERGGVARQLDCPAGEPYETCNQVVEGTDGAVVVSVMFHDQRVGGDPEVFVAHLEKWSN
jgi:hypothetical protein